MLECCAKLSKHDMDGLPILREPVLGRSRYDAGWLGKLSKHTVGGLPIWRESVWGWKLNRATLSGQALRTGHGVFGHLEGVSGGLETGSWWVAAPSFPNTPCDAGLD